MIVKHSSSHWGAIEAHVEDGRLKPGRLAPPQILDPSA